MTTAAITPALPEPPRLGDVSFEPIPGAVEKGKVKFKLQIHNQQQL